MKTKQLRTRLVRVGNALGVRIPKGMLEQVGLSTRLLRAGEVGPQVELVVEQGAIIVRPYHETTPSFEVQLAPLLEQVGVAPPEAQQLVLQAIAGTVDWLVRAREARERLAAIVREVYLRHRDNIEQLKERGQRMWEREDLVWFLLLHRVVTSQSDVAADPALSYKEVRNLMLTAEDPAGHIAQVLGARGGLVLQVRERAEALLRCFQMVEDEGGLDVQNEHFKSLTDRHAMQRFLLDFATDQNGWHIGAYTNYDPFEDLYTPNFSDQLIVGGVLLHLLEKLRLFGSYAPPQSAASNGGQSAYELFYRQVSERAKLQPWDLEKLISGYYGEIVHLLDEPPDVEHGTQVGSASREASSGGPGRFPSPPTT